MNDLIEAFSRCRLPTDFYRLQIPLECTASPSDFAFLQQAREQLPAPAQEWLSSVWQMMFSEVQALRPFVKQAVGDHVWRYALTGSDAAGKDLLIAFADQAHRIFLPTAVILQHLPDAPMDVVLVQDPSRKFFLTGAAGYGKDLSEVLARLRSDLKPERYRRVICLGGSSGGAAALRAGVVLGAARAVALCGRLPSAEVRAAATQRDVETLLSPCVGVDKSRTTLFCVFSALQSVDRAAAETLAGDGLARLVPVRGQGKHNLLFSLLKQRRLARFLRDALFAEPVDEPAAGPRAAAG